MSNFPSDGDNILKSKKVVFFSDTHIFSKKCKIKPLHKFIKHLDGRIKSGEVLRVIMIGDIIDLWCLREGLRMKPEKQGEHLDCVRMILGWAKHGCQVDYILGNHDHGLHKLGVDEVIQLSDKFTIHKNPLHCVFSSHGSLPISVLCMHGHEFDLMTKYAWLGDLGYTFVHTLQDRLNDIRDIFGWRPWSFSKYLKTKVKGVEAAMARHTERLDDYRLRHGGANFVISGHIHHPNIHGQILNTGCWVENSNLTWIELDLERMDFFLHNWNTFERKHKQSV